MKKYILLILLTILLCGCQKEEVIDKKFIDETEKNVVIEPDEDKYIDDNPVKISLYPGSDGDYVKAGNELSRNWIKKKDIVVFNAIYSDEETIKNDYFQYVWKEAAEKYDSYEKYKTGWQVTFTLKDGTIINKTIFKPSDVDEFYDYLELYLYDSAHQPLDAWYSHLLDSQMTDETIMTSMKLTCGSKYEEINSNITVKVFTYDNEDDFDEDGNYRGNSFSSIEVIDANK